MIRQTNLYLLLIAATVLSGCSSDNTPQPVQPQPQPQPVETVIYLIRHAEKESFGADPNLTTAGLARANNWAVILQDVSFEAFYSTNYNRTLQTIQPIATNNGKDVTLYNPANFSLEDVIADYTGKNVFIVGHSNTVPDLINVYLGSEIYPDMQETEFGNLYKITVVDTVVTHEMTVHN